MALSRALKSKQFINHASIKLSSPLPISDIIVHTINQTFSSGQSHTCDNVIILNNKPNFFEWRMFPEFEEKKHPQSVLMFIRDISSRKEIEAKIQESIENKNKIPPHFAGKWFVMDFRPGWIKIIDTDDKGGFVSISESS